MEYDQACRILSDHGYPVVADQALGLAKETALARFCQNQPVMISELPATQAASVSGEGALDQPAARYHACLLPYSGLTIIGNEMGGEDSRGGFSLNLGRLLQFLMGLESVLDTVITPKRKVATA